MRSKAYMNEINLQHGTTAKQGRTGRLKSKNGYAQKYRQTVRGIRGVSPGEEKVGYGGKDLQKRKVLSLK